MCACYRFQLITATGDLSGDWVWGRPAPRPPALAPTPTEAPAEPHPERGPAAPPGPPPRQWTFFKAGQEPGVSCSRPVGTVTPGLRH